MSSPIQIFQFNVKTKPILWAILCLFFLLKINHVFIPLFHDELGVYGQGLFYMIDHGPSMMPGDMIPVLSRGHPLFFVFITSCFTQLLGGSYVVAKCFILFLSLALVVATFCLGKAYFDEKTALIAILLLVFQAVFFAQSTLILPEVLLALLTVLSLLFYHKKQFVAYFISASLMLLTKETGLVLLGGIGLHILIVHQFKLSKKCLLEGLKWSLPILSFFFFLLIQKLQNGWFLYPYHTGLISFDPQDIASRFFLGIKHLFYDQGRVFIGIAALTAYFRSSHKLSTTQRSNFYLIAAVIGVFFAFSSLNYFMARYQLMVLPLLMILFAAVLKQFPYWLKTKLIVPILLGLSLPFHYSFTGFSTDENMNYLITVRNMQQSITALDSISQNKAVKVLALFPEIWALIDPRHGYTTNPNYELYDRYNDSCDYIIRGRNNLYDEDAALHGKIDQLLMDENRLKNSSYKKLYERQYYFSNQSIFKNKAPIQ